MSSPKKNLPCIDVNQIFKYSYNREGQGIDVFVRNGDVPVEYTYRTFQYDEDENLVAIQYFISGCREKTPIITVADVGGSLGGKYLLIESIDTLYYVWFNTGASTDPAPAGRTGLEVNISSNDSAITIATAFTAKMNEDGSDFVAASTNNAIIVQNKRIGAVSPITDVDTGFNILTNSTNTYEQGQNRIHKATKLMDYNDCNLIINEEIVYHTEEQY